MKSWLKAPTFSPKGFVVRAAVIALLYGLLSLLGFRDSMSVLSMTVPEGSRAWAFFSCLAYLITYFLWLLGVPILLIAAGLMKAVDFLAALRGGQGGAPSSRDS